MDVNAESSHGERITLNELLKNTSLYQNKQLLDMAADSTDYSGIFHLFNVINKN